MTRVQSRIAITFGLALVLASVWLLERASVSASAKQKNRALAASAQSPDAVTVHAARRGFPYVNLSDGRDLPAPLDGASADAAPRPSSPAGGLAPLAMTAADFDEDGLADLVCAYDSPQGAFLAVYRGNVDSIYPHTAAANQRRAQGTFTDAPFLAPARIFAAPLAGELIVAGDVNGDSHQDLVITSRTSHSLYVLAGDGKGGINPAKEMALPGAVTALGAGDFNRRDGIIDLIVGVAGDGGPRALMFAGQNGGLNLDPEVFALPDAASDFAIGQFDNDAAADIAIAAGRSLLTVYGRDRGIFPDAAHARANPATTGKRDFAFRIRAIAAGNFSEGQMSGLGLLADDGAMYALRVKDQAAKRKAKKRAPQWAVEKLAATAQSNSKRVLAARVSSRAADVLLLLDGDGHQVRVIETAAGRTATANRSATVDLDVEGEAIAALPMRLNADALDDLVILRRGASAPAVMISAPTMTFNVTNTGDNGGVDPAPLAGTGTLRQAIIDANATAGADTIQFNIGTNLQTINLLASLPAITDPVTIDGTTQMGFTGTPLIELNGTGASGGTDGLDIQASNVTVRALIINRFDGDGISLSGPLSNVTIKGNFIGTDPTGAAAMGNALNGITMFDSPSCQIGGTVAGEGNLVSGNGNSGIAANSNSSGTQIQGNRIGTNAAGTAAIGNTGNGIAINTSITVGGTTANARNLISGNSRGIFFQGNPTGSLVQGNRIGTEVTGTSGLPNFTGFGYGDTTGGTTVGGTAAGAGNTIAFNTFAGIDLGMGGGGGNSFLGNSIFSNGTLGIDIDGDGVTANDNCDSDGSANGRQNFPMILSVTPDAMATIQGTLNSTPSTTFRIEFFSNPSCDATGFGEGKNFIGAANVMTNAACNANFNVMLGPVSAGEAVTATATDAAGNTSEFSPCFTVPAAASAAMFVEFDAMPNPVLAGNNITYSMSVGNSGPDPAINATVTEAVPANTTFQSLSAPPGWNCTTPTVGGTGTVTCTNPSQAAATQAAFTIDVKVDPSTPSGTMISGTVNVSSATADPDPSNNSDTIAVTVATEADISVVKTDSPDPVANGGNLTYTITVTNAGPSTASGVALIDNLPASTTFVSLSGPGSCTTPAVGSTGTVTCVFGDVTPGTSLMKTLVVNVNSSPGNTVMNTAVVSTDTSDPNAANNSSTTSTLVSAATCTIGCPANITVNSSAARCEAAVAYPAPTTSGSCGTVTCVPPSGSTFPRGATTVTCTAGGTPSCSFVITVVDATPPTILCPGSITTNTAPDRNNAVVDYVPATATDACGVTNSFCLPPSGSTFPLGITTVNCTAVDQANNQANCSFTVTVVDGDAPTIRCPNNISMELPATQTSATISYPPPAVTDNLPGVTVSCAPPSGSTFPLGITTVNCTAVDVTGNRSTCSFNVSLTGGPPLLDIILANGKGVLEFGTDRPVPVTRKNKNVAKGPCAAFTVVNRSFATLTLTLVDILRIGSDVDGQRITDPKEGGTYSVSLVGTDGLETPLDIGETISIARGGRANFCLRFSPVLPGVAGRNTQLSAPQAIPDLVKSRVVFRVAGTTTVSVDVNAIVGTALQLINPNNPKKPATINFSQSGDEFLVTFAVYDPNLDVTRARYEFLDTGGAVIAGPFDVDLAQAIAARNLVRGQSFTVTQRFSGANSNRQISLIRVTVFDSETSVTSPTAGLGAAATVTVQAAGQLRFETVVPSPVVIASPSR